MGLWDTLLEGGINALTGGSSSSSSSGGTVAAYKGDGLQGLGNFLAGIGTAYAKISVKDRQTTDRLKDNARATLDAITNYVHHKYNNDSYNRCDAITEAERAVKGTFYDYKNMLPELLVDCRYGIYNSTSTQALLNDAYARTIEKAAALRMQAIVDYRRLQIEGDRIPLDAIGRQIESYTNFEQNREEVRNPDVSAFAKDAAIMMVAITILNLFTNRKYKEDDATGALT